MSIYTRTQIVTIVIPSGTPRVNCPGCGKPVYYVTRSCDVRMPVEVDGHSDTIAPSHFKSTTQHDGLGVAHLPRCRGKR